MSEHWHAEDEIQDLPAPEQQLHHDLLAFGQPWHAPASRLVDFMRTLEAETPTNGKPMHLQSRSRTQAPLPVPQPTHPIGVRVGGMIAFMVIVLFAGGFAFVALQRHGAALPSTAIGSFGDTRGLITDVAMVSADEGWAIGYTPQTAHPDSTVMFYHYQHGTWMPIPVQVQQLNLRARIFHAMLAMINATSGWAVCGDGFSDQLLRFQAGHWSLVTNAPQGFVFDAIQPDGKDGLWTLEHAVQGRKFEHFDGQHWESMPLAKTIGKYDLLYYTGFSMLSLTEGWFTVSTQDTSNNQLGTAMIHWHNGTWSLAYFALPSNDQGTVAPADNTEPKSIHMFTADAGWATDGRTALYVDVNGHWQTVPFPPASTATSITVVRVTGLHDVWLGENFFPALPEGHATIGNFLNAVPVIYHYQDGQWMRMALPIRGITSAWLLSFGFTDAQTGWAVGYNELPRPSSSASYFAPFTQQLPLIWRLQQGQWSLYTQGK